MRSLFAAFSLLLPVAAHAHSFGRLYNLPVPFWLYAYGATAALVLSFLIVGVFVTAKSTAGFERSLDLGDWRFVRVLRRLRLITALKILSLVFLLLCIATGFFGNPNPYQNLNMTLFWIVFVLGFAYATALIGDLYSSINPWRVLAEGLGRFFRSDARGRWTYPEALAYWPALLFYMAFIWLELFGHSRPFSLALMLAIYSGINLAGAGAFGIASWFRYCEFFSVFLRLTALMAPLDYSKGKLRLRWPFAGLIEQRAESLSLLVFVLFMLSSTAYDGLRTTVPWIRMFWNDPLGLITPLIGGRTPILAYVELRPFYLAYESLWMLASPFLYLAVYLLFIELSRRAARSTRSLHELALRFAFSLLPIALVYNITHYYTLIITQGVKIFSLLSDPFGWGWNLFGSAGLWRAPYLPEMGVVWHSQVGLILFGHIVSVFLAHHEALRVFPTRRAATLSQLPMLVLMMLFTTFGLWILAQPIQSGL